MINLDKNALAEHMIENLSLCEHDRFLHDSIISSREGTKIYPERHSIHIDSLSKGRKTRVKLSDDTSFTAAKRYAGTRIAVLNFANAKYPGGGCLYGARAQEESLCRCSTLYECLIDQKNYDRFYNRHSAVGYGTSDIIYTPNVYVLSDNDLAFDERSKWFPVDIITCAAPNLSAVNTSKDFIKNKVYRVMRHRIERIFRAAIKNRVDVLILGAFGCGVFNNPPEVVARAMFDVCEKYNGYIPAVEFAVFDPSEERKNYTSFLAEYSKTLF